MKRGNRMSPRSILNFNEMFLDGCQVTIPELERKLDELAEGEVIELWEVDKDYNLHFETNKYGIYN